MRLAALFFAAVLLSEVIQAQQDVIRPGDILTVTLLNKWHSPTSKTVVVTPDGKLTPPLVEGMTPSQGVNVDGLELGEAAERLQPSYETLKRGYRVKVVIQRGMLDQVLRL